MSDPALPKIDPTAYIRTYVPYFVGLILGWALTNVPAVASAVAFLDTVLPAGTDWRGGLNLVVIALVTAAYYKVAREFGRRWPVLERFLLGSAKQPLYRPAPTAGRKGLFE